MRAQVQSEPIFNNWRFTIDIPLKIKRKWVKHIAELYRIPVWAWASSETSTRRQTHHHLLGQRVERARRQRPQVRGPSQTRVRRHAMRRFAVLQEGVKEGKVKIVSVPDADGALLAGQERV